MPTIYEIDFTDLNASRTFQVSSYTTNGPATPGSDILPSTSTTAATSLLLTGKGFPNYGEIVAENMVHLLENFSSHFEPSYPISGQLWYDTLGAWDTGAVGSPSVPVAGAPVLRVFNSRKHSIIANHAGTPSAGLVSTITILGDFTSRFENGLRIRSYDIGGAQTEYIVSSPAPALDANGNTYFFISPAPGGSIVGDTIGGWDRIQQENNTFLSENLNASDPVTGIAYNIVNMNDPVNDKDATTMSWVLSQISSVSTLGSLTDVDLAGSPTPSTNDFLVFEDGSPGGWTNKSGLDAGVLPLSGGTMTGHIQPYIGTAPGPMDAVNKDYVDTVVGGGVGFLDDLLDVTITAPTTGSVLQYQGLGMWTNAELSAFGYLETAGGTMTGHLEVYTGTAPSSTQAVSKQYVDDLLADDKYVVSGAFSSITQTLDLAFTDLTSVQVFGWNSLEIQATQLRYTLLDPIVLQRRSLYLEHVTGVDYPEATGAQILTDLNISLGNMSKPRDRAVFEADGNPTVDTSAAGAYGNFNFDYVPGFSKLQVFHDGAKKVASEHGWLRVAADPITGSPIPSGDVDELWPGFPTGLTPGILYDFQITVNTGGSAIGPLTVSVNGSLCQTLGQLVDQLNLWADNNPSDFGDGYSVPPFGVQMFDGVIVFYSSYPGVESYVSLTDGAAGTGFDNLFASLVGASPYSYDINPATINSGERNDGTGTNAPAPLTWHYREIGRVGRASYVFEWESGEAPTGPGTDTIEIISDHDMMYSQTLQP